MTCRPRSWLRRVLEWIFPLSEVAKHSLYYPPVDLYEVRIKGKPAYPPPPPIDPHWGEEMIRPKIDVSFTTTTAAHHPAMPATPSVLPYWVCQVNPVMQAIKLGQSIPVKRSGRPRTAG